jgi:hypothetical protein
MNKNISSNRYFENSMNKIYRVTDIFKNSMGKNISSNRYFEKFEGGKAHISITIETQ